MPGDYGTVGADVRGGESGAGDFTTAVTMLLVGPSGEDVGGASDRVPGEGVEAALLEAMIEAVDGLKGLRGGEGERLGASADNGTVLLV